MTETEQLNTLESLGWRKFFAEQIGADSDLVPARVCRQDLDRYHLVGPQGDVDGILPGRFRIEASSKAELPTVGDWVLYRPAADGDSVVIEIVLARKSKFSRKEAGERFEEQVVAANVDTVFIVTGLDNNFNVGRIERYLVLAWNSGARPVVVLSKADLLTDDEIDERREALARVLMDTPVHVVSGIEGDGLDTLRAYASDGETVALLGSSGVGKSTIVNALLGYQRFETGEVREGDSKGRHTTTYRELCVAPTGGLLIDTPGMREIQIWSEDGLGGFDDVEALATLCRFNDCGHDSEPGCAVREAVDRREIEAARVESWHKFRREIKHFEERHNAAARAERRQEWKKFSKKIRKRPTKRDL